MTRQASLAGGRLSSAKVLATLSSLLGRDSLRAIKNFFDDDYYRAKNVDVADAGIDPFSHFMKHGWIEGRNPSATFDTLFYRDHYLPGQAVNPLVHWVELGRKRSAVHTAPRNSDEAFVVQRSLTEAQFSIPFYLTQVSTLEGEPLRHYLFVGWKHGFLPYEGFDANAVFDGAAFINQLNISPFYYAASRERFMRALEQKPAIASEPEKPAVAEPAPSQGKAEPSKRPNIVSSLPNFSERLVESSFDASYYLAVNHDVREAGLDPLTHFCRFGWREKRSPNRIFDIEFYSKRYSDKIPADTNPYVHYLTVGRAEGLRPNAVGSGLYDNMRMPTEHDWVKARKAAAIKSAECAVIMPVYKGREETLASICAVLTNTNRTRFVLHVVDDCSPDPVLSEDLRKLAARGLFFLDKNEQNLGFVKSVNKALRRHTTRPVILLNTDAKVSGDWIDRLMAHAKADPTIATVTPLSNNATIFSYPAINRNNCIEPELSIAEMDRLAARCNAGRRCDVPVGVGFCFLMSVASRAKVGLLDEVAFGKGYGEENDFCLRAAKAGFRNVAAEDIFVYHVGEVSFGKPDLTKSAPGQRALIGKHPEYPDLVGQYLNADQLEDGRLRLDLARLAEAGKGAAIFIYHAATGGIVTHVRDEEAELQREGRRVIHIRVGVGHRWGVEIRADWDGAPFCPNLAAMPFNRLRPHLSDFVKWMAPAFFHVHSMVGFDWQATLGLMDLIGKSEVPYRFTLHDYSVVCHRNDLVQPSGRFCGLAPVEVCRLCIASDRTYPEAIDPAERRRVFNDFLLSAERIFAPSHDIVERLARNGAQYKVEVKPHLEKPAVIPKRVHKPNRAWWDIVTFGAIGPHKGSRVILGLARDAANRDLPLRFTIIGYSDVPRDMAAAGVTETGRYQRDEDAFAIAAGLDPACILLPSIWPETYCYTLSMAFKLECLPVVFDLGAQAERIREQNFGELLDYSLLHDLPGLNDRLLAIAAKRQPSSTIAAAKALAAEEEQIIPVPTPARHAGADRPHVQA